MRNFLSWHVFVLTFTTLFIAEMGDKTQLAVFSLVTESKQPLSVFLGASLALTVVTLVGVIFGGSVTRLVPPQYLKIGAGVLFAGIGFYTLWEAFSGIIFR